MPTMRSQRRMKFFAILVLLAVLTTLYLTSAARQTRESAFYTRTQSAISERERTANSVVEPNLATDDDVSKRLKAAEDKAKKSANNKGNRIQEVVAAGDAEKEKDRVSGKVSQQNARVEKDTKVGEHDEVTGEKSVAGRVIMKDSSKAADGVDGVAKVGNVGDSVKAAASSKATSGSDAGEETQEEHEAELEINTILKKSPIIIFSKSYCRFSAKAKKILLEDYSITPAPYVVELDQHPLGSAIQAQLQKSTGRSTVPNVLINGRSIGGGDDIETLHLNGKIEETIRSMGGKRITEARPAAEAATEKSGLKRRRIKRTLNA
ncbi:glutaredoxin domain-containing protein [Diplodia corticola]|uniref:Glutaredoxin domain-containing protein n=1 Tax=Diplodia corticola TaxID=236234 RepID=A0A1J9R518_9PEZI|nr:glutaredoxin domain-containing protein [Diplodia corticola]OJD35649.1 glutaredoxin domain-containing protein [Diplodia corticola]